MIVGGYTLDLYCEMKGPPVVKGGLYDAAGHYYNGGKASSYYDSYVECAKKARKDGWRLFRDRQPMEAYCPACSRKKLYLKK